MLIYQIDTLKKEVTIDHMCTLHKYIGIMNFEELKNNYRLLSISKKSLQRCEETSSLSQNIIIPHLHYYYGLMNLINARDVFVKKDMLAFFIFKNMLMVVVIDDDDCHIEDIFKTMIHSTLEKDISIARLVYDFFGQLLSRDHQYIEELQEDIEELEEHDIQEESLKFTSHLRKLNKELLLLGNYYDYLTSMSEELQMNHHDIFEKEDIRYFEILTKRIERLSHHTQILRELLHQAQEAHQSRLDYQLNKTMQFFTVITTIFMPLTLMTGWYGMNFKNMPELYYSYSYFILIAVSIIIVIGLVFWFKKKKYF